MTTITYTSFETSVIRAILKANTTGNFGPVRDLVEGTELENEMEYHGYSLFQVRSRAYARYLVRKFLYDGQQPVFTITDYYDEPEVCRVSSNIVEEEFYYVCCRTFEQDQMCCFAPHLEVALKEANLELDFSGEHARIYDPLMSETKYERMARDYGFAA